LALALALGSPSRALAGTYRVDVCTPEANAGVQFEPPPLFQQGFVTEFACGQAFGGIEMLAKGPTAVVQQEWSLAAPPDLTIGGMEFDQDFLPRPFRVDRLFVTVSARNPDQVLESVQGSSLPAGGRAEFNSVNAKKVVGELRCDPRMEHDLIEWCNGNDGQALADVTFRNIKVRMVDAIAPTLGVTAIPSPTTPLRGTVQIPYEAGDQGSGVKAVVLLRDFVRTVSGIFVIGEQHDSNDGNCVEPYKQMVPCRLQISSPAPFSVDTTKIPDGIHTITAVVADAAGNETDSPAFTILVHNAPTNTARPALAGTAQVGQTLRASDGAWEAAVGPFADQWLRCPGAVVDKSEAGCTRIAGATQRTYIAAAADVGRRLVAKVTATNPHGDEAALSPPSAVVAEKPGGSEAPRPGAAPQTRISKHPRRKVALRSSKLSLAKFTFSSDQPSSSFKCKLDKAPFKSCRSPFKRKVKPGRHSFQVRAVNSTGVADPTPAVFRWRIS
jgi:hypothetical protein